MTFVRLALFVSPSPFTLRRGNDLASLPNLPSQSAWPLLFETFRRRRQRRRRRSKCPHNSRPCVPSSGNFGSVNELRFIKARKIGKGVVVMMSSCRYTRVLVNFVMESACSSSEGRSRSGNTQVALTFWPHLTPLSDRVVCGYGLRNTSSSARSIRVRRRRWSVRSL